MQFDSLAAALAMGGHGVYVWPVYIMALLVSLFLLAGPALRSRSIISEQRRHRRREQILREREADHASGA